MVSMEAMAEEEALGLTQRAETVAAKRKAATADLENCILTKRVGWLFFWEYVCIYEYIRDRRLIYIS